MPQLRRHRSNPRRSKRPRNRKRDLSKFIPTADCDFAFTAATFAATVRGLPDRFHVPTKDVEALMEAVTEFRKALAAHSPRRTSNRLTGLRKDEARKKAEAMVRRVANVIRINSEVSDDDKALVRIKVRPKRLKNTKCPQHAPVLTFTGSGDGAPLGVPGKVGVYQGGVGGGSGVHVLQFRDVDANGRSRKAKPEGCSRVELFVDLVPPGEPVPRHPAERGGWPRYVRSFTKSPIEVEYPVSLSGPMLIVYWARWANNAGETGRFSQTCVARVEGWTQSPAALPAAGAAPGSSVMIEPHRALPAGQGAEEHVHIGARYVIVQAPYALPQGGYEAAHESDHVQQPRMAGG